MLGYRGLWNQGQETKYLGLMKAEIGTLKALLTKKAYFYISPLRPSPPAAPLFPVSVTSLIEAVCVYVCVSMSQRCVQFLRQLVLVILPGFGIQRKSKQTQFFEGEYFYQWKINLGQNQSRKRDVHWKTCFCFKAQSSVGVIECPPTCYHLVFIVAVLQSICLGSCHLPRNTCILTLPSQRTKLKQDSFFFF